MNINEAKKIRSYYNSLLDVKEVLDTSSGGNFIPINSALPILLEFRHLKQDFPDMVPFDPQYEELSKNSNDNTIDFLAIRGSLSMVLGRLKTEIEDSVDIPVVEQRPFLFLDNIDLGSLIERDFQEIQRAFIARCYKSVIILCGSVVEAILLDLLLSMEEKALLTKSSPKSNDITTWSLSDLINVAVELQVVSAGIQKLSHPLREYRNIIHPGNQIRNNVQFDIEEARISIEVVHILHRDLSGN